MQIWLFASDLCVPLCIFLVIGMGMYKGNPVYDQFVRGAKDGIKTVAEIMPVLSGLFMATEVLRASGFLDFLTEVLKPAAGLLGLRPELLPLTLVKMFSSSAATGLLLDIYETYGPDSLMGRTASIQMSCTETIFYTLSVYFMAAGVKKTRYTVPGALFATAVGVAMSVFMAKIT